METFSEQGQDTFAFKHCPTPGTFLDIGGWEPIQCNNSYALERAGWRGVVMDIDDRWVSAYAGVRKSKFIVADATKTIDWSSFCTYHGLPTSLDYLSLDVDDQPNNLKSVEILRDMFVDALTFKAITVEHDAYRMGDLVRGPLRQIMKEWGYELAVADVSCRPPDPAWTFEDWFVKS
jgi:hypothetical protein